MIHKLWSKSMTVRFLRMCGVMSVLLLIAVSNAHALAVADVYINDSIDGYHNDHDEDPSSASAALSYLLGSAWAEVDIPNGTLRTFVQTSTSDVVTRQGAQVNAWGQIDDYFTLAGLPQGDAVWVTASLHVTGTLFTPPGESPNWGSGVVAYFGGPWGYTLYPAEGGEFLIDEVLTQVYQVYPDEPFRVLAELSSYGFGWDHNDVLSDFSGTAALNFDLPEGSSISSVGGFYQSSIVPEPASLVLLGTGLVGLLGLKPRKK